jgi:MFS family permease
MIVESWRADRSDKRSRGRIFGIYTMVNLAASTGGQLALTLGDTQTFLFFVLGAIFYCFALIPTAVSSSASPQPLVDVRIDLFGLWRNSPVAVFGVFCIGISNSAFGTLSAVYGQLIGLSLDTIALFASIPIMAGALAQIPIGMLSDRLDRRYVLIGTGIAAVAADLCFIVLRPEDGMVNLAVGSALGAMIYSMYPVVLAHANDHAAPGRAIQVSGGLLIVYGIGAIVGPLAAGLGMAQAGPIGLFWTTAAAHGLLLAFTLWRISQRAPVANSDKGVFVAVPLARTATPETQALALRDSDVEAPDGAGAEPQDR